MRRVPSTLDIATLTEGVSSMEGRTVWISLRHHRILMVASIVLSAGILSIVLSCFGNGTFANAQVSGCVRMGSDSTPVQGALVEMDNTDLFENVDSIFTDSTGCYFHSRTYPTGQGDPLNILVTVTDVDGDSNGVFLPQDTLLFEESTEEDWDFEYQVDFYVQDID